MNFPLISIVLGHPVRRLAACTLNLTNCPIEMYKNGALIQVILYPAETRAHSMHTFTLRERVYYTGSVEVTEWQMVDLAFGFDGTKQTETSPFL